MKLPLTTYYHSTDLGDEVHRVVRLPHAVEQFEPELLVACSTYGYSLQHIRLQAGCLRLQAGSIRLRDGHVGSQAGSSWLEPERVVTCGDLAELVTLPLHCRYITVTLPLPAVTSLSSSLSARSSGLLARHWHSCDAISAARSLTVRRSEVGERPLEAARLSPRRSGRAALREYRAAWSRQPRPEEPQEPS